ncbi:MAG: hypothetical protein ABI867_00815 [Kofleriaceae bacterium]
MDGFRGSNVQIDLSPGTPAQGPVGMAPGPGDLPAAGHFRIRAIDYVNGNAALFEIQRFEIHKIVDVSSPCFIDVGPNVRFPGIHVSEFGNAIAADTGITDIANPPPGSTEEQQIDAATAVQRMQNIAALGGPAGIKVVTSASETVYPAVDADCLGSGLPPPSCSDAESNARRLQICQTIWASDRALFEGTDRVLTAPLNGTTNGFVVGANPVSPAPLGGAQFFVDTALQRIDEYAITFHLDGTDTADPGMLFLTGVPIDGPRGVLNVHMESPLLPGLVTAELAIFADLGEDDVHF